jgi:hypothetical protein
MSAGDSGCSPGAKRRSGFQRLAEQIEDEGRREKGNKCSQGEHTIITIVQQEELREGL